MGGGCDRIFPSVADRTLSVATPPPPLPSRSLAGMDDLGVRHAVSDRQPEKGHLRRTFANPTGATGWVNRATPGVSPQQAAPFCLLEHDPESCRLPGIMLKNQ